MIVLIVFACVNVVIGVIAMAVAAASYGDHKKSLAKATRYNRDTILKSMEEDVWWMKASGVWLALSFLSYYLYILAFVYGVYRLIKYCVHAWREQKVLTTPQDSAKV